MDRAIAKGSRMAYETCGNCRHTNRPIANHGAHEVFDWKDLFCTELNVKVRTDGWCQAFNLHPLLGVGELTGASPKADSRLGNLQSEEDGRQSSFESLVRGKR